MPKLDFELPPSIKTNQQWTPPKIESDSSSYTSSCSNLEESDSEDDSFDQTIDRLLPSLEERPSLYIQPHHRAFRDIGFIFIYGVAILAWLTLGFIEVFSKVPDMSWTKSLFNALWNSAGLLLGLTFAAIVGSIIWLYLLTKFSNVFHFN
jgi:hypothetical protein